MVHGTFVVPGLIQQRVRATWREGHGESGRRAHASAHPNAPREATLKTLLDALEEEARCRAVDGVIKPVYQGGRLVGGIREYSDTLLITLLKRKRPEVYGDRFEHPGAKGGPIATVVHLIEFHPEPSRTGPENPEDG